MCFNAFVGCGNVFNDGEENNALTSGYNGMSSDNETANTSDEIDKYGWEAGFACVELIPDDLDGTTYYIAGYNNAYPVTGVLDYQCAKALWLSAEGNELLVIAIDCIGLSSADIADIKAGLGELKNSTGCSVHVISTHTHAGIDTLGLWGPVAQDGKNAGFMEVLKEGAVKAGKAAYENRCAGRLYFGYSSDGIEKLQRDSREPYVYDKNLYQLRFEPKSSGAGIRIFNYAAHAEALRSRNSLISADYPHYLCKAITEATGDNAMYIPGAVGGLIMTERLKDKNGNEYKVEENVVKTGELLAETAMKINNERELSPVLYADTVQTQIPLDNSVFIALKALGVLTTEVVKTGEGQHGISVMTSVSLIKLGDLSIAAVPGELFPELAYGVSNEFNGASPDNEMPKTFREIMGDEFLVFGLCDDEIGYIVSPNDFLLDGDNPYLSEGIDIYGRKHYEETNSVGISAASYISAALTELVDRTK